MNCWFGHENDVNAWDEHDFDDIRNRDPLSALAFAKTLSRDGRSPVLVLETTWLESQRWFLGRAKLEHVKIFTYGKGNSTLAGSDRQIAELGVDCVIADRVDSFTVPFN